MLGMNYRSRSSKKQLTYFFREWYDKNRLSVYLRRDSVGTLNPFAGGGGIWQVESLAFWI